VKKAPLYILVIALGAVRPGRATTDPTPPSEDLLTAIDFAPQRADLDASMPLPLDGLIQYIHDPTTDPGLKLRAIRALSQYPSDQARSELALLIQQLGASRQGTAVLHLRATIEALADIGGTDAVPVITPFLNAEESLDLRATAARALGTIGSPSAAQALRARQQVEQSDEVRVAITEALRKILGAT
jgi:HEAT repeat protein